MDGNLLDPEGADETLAKDWNLPELPEGNSSLPSTSQELAEIFGTSDDEEDVDFPFSISSGLPGELSLQNTETKKFGNSLLGNSDSEMFLTHTFHDTLSSMPAVPVTISQSLKEVDMQQVNVKVGGGGAAASNDKPKDEASNGKGEELKATNGNEKTSAEVKPSTKSESVSGDAKKVEEQQPSAPVLRKSVRLRQRHTTADHEGQESSNKATGAAKTKQEPAAKEEPRVKMEAGKSPKVDDGVALKEVKEEAKKEGGGPDLVKEEERRYVKSEESESGGEEDSDGSSEEEESDEDPDRLWCICRQPHDDRFMICCDQCEEWYHGDCVGISVGQGKRMEREGKEYVCPVCIARMKDAKEEREINRSARQARREETREKELKKKVGQVRRRISSGSGTTSHAPKPEDDQYGMAQLFLPDNAPKEKKGEPAKAASPTKIKKVLEEAPSLCVGPGCEKLTTPPSVYCSQDCIEKHAAYCLKKLSDRGVLHSSNPSEFVRGSGGVSVLEKGTGMLLVGVAAPSEKNLVPWLMEHPSYQVYLHTKGSKKSKEKANKKPKVEKKEPESPKMPKIPLMDPKSVRANAKKALFQTLWKRREDVSDLSDLDQEAVEKVANDIEEKLHNLYQDINPKYKNKYRSLLFNLKDTRNQGLFRKVLRSEIDTRSLVRMSSEKLASEELAQWRVQTMKRDLEKIKEREEEVGAMGGTIRKMTYKGEVEIEHTEEHLETIDTSQDYALSGKSAKSHSDSTQQQKSHSQSSKSQPPDTSSSKKQPSGSILDLLTDTTSQHHNHVYDHHCAICSGKMKKPPSPPQETVSDSSHPSPDSRTADSELMDTTSPAPAPDPAHGHVADDAPMEEEQIVWRGDFTMHGMAKFSAVAYAVSGPVEHLDEILPPVLEVMGRIAHVQVWDYVDKLRSSTSRDIVVLRFDQVAEDSEAYLAMLDYLVGKHRCGVIKSGYHGIKDMYLLPLLRHNPVAPQLLPFDGPGLPYDHPDMLLGVIVRSKNRKRASISQRLASQSTTAAGFGPLPPPTAVLPSSSETGVKRHNSASDEMYNNGVKVKRTRFQLEVGIGGQTPPILDQEEEEEEKEDVEEKDEDSPYEPGSLDPEVREGEERLMKKIQMSFYGEHRPMESATDSNSSSSSRGAQKEVFSGSSSEATTAGAVAGGAGGGSAEVSLQSSNFQSLLSQLSKEKLEELASVVSSVRGQTSAAGAGTGAAALAVATGVTAANQSPIKAADSTSSSSIVEMAGSTTSSALPLTAEEGGGPQHQLLNANYGGRAIAGQGVSGPPSQAPQWSQDQLQQQQLPEQVQPGPGAQQQHAQYYQGAAATQQYSGLAEQQHTVQQQQQPGAPGVQVYPPSAAPQAQGGSPYDNYPPPPASQSQLAMERQHHHHHHHHQDGTATGSPYASSPGQPQPQQQQQYGAGGNQQPLHGHHGAPPTHRGHTHQQWEQHQGEYRQDYGSSGTGGHSNYYDGGVHGYRGEGGNRMPPRGGPHHHHHHHHHHHSGHGGGDGGGGGWDEGRGRGGHRGHQYHGNKPDRYHDHWHGRGDHDRERHWR